MLLFPIGQSLGVYHFGARAEDHVHQVRLGREIVELGDQEFRVWSLAHGLADRPVRESTRGEPVGEGHGSVGGSGGDGSVLRSGGPVGRSGGPVLRSGGDGSVGEGHGSVGEGGGSAGEQWWDRACVETLLRHEIREVPALVDRLLQRRLLAEVEVGGPGATDFARRHRLLPLHLGLGNSAGLPAMFAAGTVEHPLVGMTRVLYDVWLWGHLSPNLLAACAAQAAPVMQDEPEVVEPAMVEKKAGEQAPVGQAVARQAVAGQEVAGQEVAGQEVVGQAVVGQEVAGQAVAGQEVVGQEVAGQAVAGQEVVGQVAVGQVAVGQRVAGQEVAERGGSGRSDEFESQRLLCAVLTALHALLTPNAACLDLALSEVSR